MAITNGYATLNELKAVLKITDTLDDSLLEGAIEAASRLIDGYASRVFYSVGSATRNYAADDFLTTTIDDLQSLTTLSSTTRVGQEYTTWESTDYQLEPVNGVSSGISQPYTSIRAVGNYVFPVMNGQALVRVTGVWGWAAVPTPIKQACLLQASRIFKRYDSPLGVAGFGDMGVVRVGSRLDPDVEHLVMPYRSLRSFA